MGFLFPGTVFEMCDMLGPFCLDSFMDENQDIVSHLVFIQLFSSQTTHVQPSIPTWNTTEVRISQSFIPDNRNCGSS